MAKYVGILIFCAAILLIFIALDIGMLISIVRSGDSGDTIGIPALLRSSIVYYCAGLVEISRGNSEQGDLFLKLATSNFNPS